MSLTSSILVVAGLALFESVASVDNAIINADTLAGMQPRARRWFLSWGILVAVFGVRGLLPWLIVWVATPGLGPWQAFWAGVSGDAAALSAIQQSAPVLLVGGALFFVFLFLHWLFIEPKEIGLPGERYVMRQGGWFYAFASLILTMVVWLALARSPMLAFGAVLGSSAFFITHGFRGYAEKQEKQMASDKGNLSDVGKIVYLEIIDMTFSIDGIVGAFAFTLSVPLILVGNGIGAVIVRQLTYHGVVRIRKYVYLKNGAMYSIFVLGLVMLARGFELDVPEWLSPLATFAIVGYFFLKSIRRATH